jgi:hypothetical protein
MVDKSQNLLFYWMFRPFFCWQFDLLLLISSRTLSNLPPQIDTNRHKSTKTVTNQMKPSSGKTQFL